MIMISCNKNFIFLYHLRNICLDLQDIVHKLEKEYNFKIDFSSFSGFLGLFADELYNTDDVRKKAESWAYNWHFLYVNYRFK